MIVMSNPRSATPPPRSTTACVSYWIFSASRISAIERYHRNLTIDAPRTLSSSNGDDNGRSSTRPTTDLAPAVALFHGLSDPTRLAILERLTEGEAAWWI